MYVFISYKTINRCNVFVLNFSRGFINRILQSFRNQVSISNGIIRVNDFTSIKTD